MAGRRSRRLGLDLCLQGPRPQSKPRREVEAQTEEGHKAKQAVSRGRLD